MSKMPAKLALVCLAIASPIVVVEPASSQAAANQSAVARSAQNVAREPLEIGELTFSGDIDREQIKQLMPLLLQSARLSSKTDQEPNLPVIGEANIYVRGLKFSDAGANHTSTIVISNLAIQGLKIDVDGQITMREILGEGIDSTKLESMFYNTPHVLTSQLRIPRFRARNIQADGYNKVAGANFKRWPLRFNFTTAEASGFNYLERPLKRSNGAPQRESRFTLNRLQIERLGTDALGHATMIGFQVQSNDLPNITLGQMSVSGANWRAGSYLLRRSALRNSCIGRNEPAPTETVTQLWPGGPFDIGLSGLDIADLSVKYEGVSAILDRFAFRTKKSASGFIERFEVPLGSLSIKVENVSDQDQRMPISGLVARVLGLLKLEQFVFSWEALGRFDSQRDITRLDRLSIKLNDALEFNMSVALQGVENARSRLNASGSFADAWAMFFPTKRTSESSNANWGNAREMDATPANGSSAPVAKANPSAATIGAITISSLRASLADLGGLDRISNAYAIVQNERGNTPIMDQRAQRCYYADYSLETARSRPSSFLARYPAVLEGFVRWIKVGGKLEVTQTVPVNLQDFGRAGIGQPNALNVRTAALTPLNECRR